MRIAFDTARSFRIAALTALAVFATIGVVTSVFQAFFPLTLGYGEDCVLLGAWGLLNGHGLYRAEEVNAIPSFLSLYTPVFYLIEAVLLELFGLSHAPGRIFATTMTLLCAAAIGAVARKKGGGIFGATAAGLLFLCCWPVMLWMRQLRVDTTAIFFELVAVYFLLGGYSRKRAIGFVVFAVLAGFTKQTAFTLVVGAMIGKFFEEDRDAKRSLLIAAAAYAATAAAVFIVIDAATSGGFHKIAMGSHFIQYTSDKLWENLSSVLKDPVSLAVLGLGAFSTIQSKSRFFAAFIAIPLLMALATAGKNGANVNYFIETIVAATIATGVMVGSKVEGKSKAIKPALACLVIALAVMGGLHKKSDLFGLWVIQFQDERNYSKPELVSLLEQLPPGSLVYSHQPFTSIMAGMTPVATDPFNITAMSRAGSWDATQLVTLTSTRKIAAFVNPEKIDPARQSQFIPDGVAEEVVRNYTLLRKRYNKQFVYVPKKIRPAY